MTSALRVAAVVCLVAGSALGGAGVHEFATPEPEPVYGLSADALDGTTVRDADRVVDYGNLSTARRGAFLLALENRYTTTDGALVRSLAGTVVEYRGERYLLVSFHSDTVGGFVAPMLLAVGAVLAALGAILFLAGGRARAGRAS